MMAAAAAADVVQPLPVDLHALEGDGSVSLLQTRMEKMRRTQVIAEAGDSVTVNTEADAAEQASKAMKEMGDAITSLLSPDMTKQGEMKSAKAIKDKASLQSTAIGKASHAIEDVKQAFSKLLAKEEIKAKAGKEKKEKKKESKDAESVSFAQQYDNRIGVSSTFDAGAAADFWDDAADVKGSSVAREEVSAEASKTSENGMNIWDDDWKAASDAGFLDVTKSATDNSYLTQSHYLQAALEGQQVQQKSKVESELEQKVVEAQKSKIETEPKEKVVLTWGHDEEPSKNSLLSAETAGFPSLVSKEHNDDKQEDEESISSKQFETSDEEVVKHFVGGNVAQNSKAIQSILGDMLLTPDDQGLFGLPQDQEESDVPSDHKSDVQNKTVLATGAENKSEVQNKTVLATNDQNQSGVRNKTSLASVGIAIKSVISSVENSSWPWSKTSKPADVLAKDESNNTKAVSQNASEAKSSTNGTVLERSNDTVKKEGAAKNSANTTVLDKSNGTAAKEITVKNAANGTVLEKSNDTASKKVAATDTANVTKTNATLDAKAAVNDTSAGAAVSNSSNKK